MIMRPAHVFATVVVVFNAAMARSQGAPSASAARTVQSDPRVARADSLYLAQDFKSAATQYAAAAGASPSIRVPPIATASRSRA